MRKLIFTILLFPFIINAQTLVTVGMTKSQTASAVNENLTQLINYLDPSLIDVIDLIPANLGSNDIYGLNTSFDTLATYTVTSLTDSVWYGMRGVRYRLAINTNFQTLYNESNSNVDWIFIENTGITDTTEIKAIRYLTTALVDSSLFDKVDVVYPLVGGTATTHKYNLISPYDADTSYRLTFDGTIVHDDSGIKGNGFSGYGNSHYVMTDTSSFHMMFYSLTDTLLTDIEIGTEDVNDNYSLFGSGYNVSGEKSLFLNTQEASSGFTTIENDNSKGQYFVTGNDTALSTFSDGVRITVTDNDLSEVSDSSIYIMSYNSKTYGAYQFSNKQLDYVSIGDYLSDDQTWTYSEIIRTFQEMVGRADTVSGRYINREKSSYPIATTQPTVDSIPSETITARQAEWEAMDLGAMVHYNGRTYYPEDFLGRTHSPYELKPDTTHIDVGKWIAPIDSAGADYCVLTVFEATGYSLTETSVPFPQRLIDKYGGFTKYDSEINPFLDTSLFRNFIDTCEIYGIEPIPYVNPMRNFNLQPVTGFAHLNWDSLDCVHYNNWLSAYIQELINEYDFNYIWIDGWKGHELDTEGKAMVTDFQLLYNSVKVVDPNCLVIMNELVDTGFVRFPYDIGSSEEAVIDLGDVTDLELADTDRYYDGTHYYIPKEFVLTPLEGHNWYVRGNDNHAVRTVADIQTFIDRSKAVGVNVSMAVCPNPSGLVNENQWNIWRNIVW